MGGEKKNRIIGQGFIVACKHLLPEQRVSMCGRDGRGEGEAGAEVMVRRYSGNSESNSCTGELG